jgi:hypothetical protein
MHLSHHCVSGQKIYCNTLALAHTSQSHHLKGSPSGSTAAAGSYQAAQNQGQNTKGYCCFSLSAGALKHRCMPSISFMNLCSNIDYVKFSKQMTHSGCMQCTAQVMSYNVCSNNNRLGSTCGCTVHEPPCVCTYPVILEGHATAGGLGFITHGHSHCLLALKNGHLDDLPVVTPSVTQQACHLLAGTTHAQTEHEIIREHGYHAQLAHLCGTTTPW